MKNYINFFGIISFIFLSFYSIGQDHDWLIKNGDNKKFEIQDLNLPNTTCNSEARNDIFIIFKDGSYYNSRIPNDDVVNNNRIYLGGPCTTSATIPHNCIKGYAYYPLTTTTTTESYSLKFNFKDTVEYLYLTGIYDEDDDPEGRIVPTTDQTNNSNIPSISQEILSANQNVVIGKDITIIINYEGLTEKQKEAIAKNILKLKYNKYFITGGNLTEYSNGLFTPSPVFNIGSSKYPSHNNNAEVNSIETTNITFNENGFAYINIKAKDINELRSTQSSPGIKHILFELYVGSEVIDTLAEKVLTVHDPNYIQINKKCKDNNNNEYIQYYCTFKNISTEPADNLKVTLKLPPSLDAKSIKIIESRINGLDTNFPSSSLIKNGLLEIKWKEGLSIANCPARLGDNNGKAEIVFCVKNNTSKSISTMISNELEITNAYTYFTGTGGSITEYVLKYNKNLCTLDSDSFNDFMLKNPGKIAYYENCLVEVVECDECSVCDFSCYLEKNKMPIGIAVFLTGGLLILGARRMKKLKEQGERMRRINEEDNNLDS